MVSPTNARTGRQAQDDEGELGALREEEAELCRSRHRPAEDEARRGVGDDLHDKKKDSDPDHRGPEADERAEVEGEADRDEEEAEQQTAKRFDLRLDYRPIRRLGDDHAAEEGAQGQRQADRPGRPPGRERDEKRHRRENLFVARARDQAEQGPDHETREQHRDHEGTARLQERNAHGRRQGFAGAERGSHDEEEDRGHVLEDQDGGSREPDRTVLLMSLGDEPGDHRGRGERQRRPDQKRRHRRQAEQQAEEAERERAGQHLDRSEAEDVARLFADMAEREVQADVEEQEHDPELGERRDHGAVGDEVEADAAQRQPEDEVADDRAEADRAGGDRGDDAERQQQDDGDERRQNAVRVRHFRPRRG